MTTLLAEAASAAADQWLCAGLFIIVGSALVAAYIGITRR